MDSLNLLALAAVLLVGLVSSDPEIPTFEAVVNGDLASVNQFPWQVSIQGRLNTNVQTLCGGALIATGHILTSANCVDGVNFRSLKLGLGSNNISTPLISFEINPNLPNVRIIHPDYNPQTFANNIALIRLPARITPLVQSVAFVPLPPRPQFTILQGRLALVSGFGRPNDQSEPSQLLRFARTRVIDPNVCARFYGFDVAGGDSTICTTGDEDNKQGPCANDNGSPLVLPSNNPNDPTVYLIGIQSFIPNQGCNAGHPAGYVEVGSYLRWISENGVQMRF